MQAQYSRACEICGAVFRPRRTQIEAGGGRTCSKACRAIAAKGRGAIPLVDCRCGYCGELFLEQRSRVANGKGRFCSKACYFKAKTLGNTLLCSCRGCGTDFVRAKSIVSSGGGKYCSNACYLAHVHPISGLTSRQDAKAKRFLRMRLTRTEPRISRKAIFERDEWRCWICGEPVDRQVSWPHPQYPTLDHVMPLSKGGIHDPSNLRCAHNACNQRRGNRHAVATEADLSHSIL